MAAAVWSDHTAGRVLIMRHVQLSTMLPALTTPRRSPKKGGKKR